MTGFICRRMLLSLYVIFGVSIFTFLLINFAPGDPAEAIALARYGIEGASTNEGIEQLREVEGLNAPVFVQYYRWLGHILQGDLGKSLISGEPVAGEILCRFPATLELALASMMVSLAIAIPVGILSAVKKHSLMDYLSMSGALFGVSIPNFLTALVLILIFSVYLGWFPVYGADGIRHLILPAITLGSSMAAIITRLTRSSMLEVLEQNYIRTARAKGLREKFVIGKHAFRNAVIPVITVLGLQFAYLLEGSVIVETIFARPGIGRLLVDSIYARDFALIQGCTLFITVFLVLINLLIDISYAWLDPRIKYEGKRI